MRLAGGLAGHGARFALLSLIQKGFALVTVPIFTRVLAPEDYGVITLVNTVAAVWTLGLGFGLDSVLVMRLAEAKSAADARRIASTTLWFRLAVFGLATLLVLAALERIGPLVAGEGGARAVGFAAVSTLGMVFVGHCGQILQARAEHRRRFHFELAITVIYVAVNLLAVAVFRVGPEGAFYAGAVTAMLVGPAYWWVTRDAFAPQIGAGTLRDLLASGLPLVPTGLAATVIAAAGPFLLKSQGDLAQVGVLGVAMMLANLLSVAVYGFSQIWLPYVHSSLEQPGAPERFARAHALYAAVLFVLAVAVALFSREAVTLLAPAAYADAALYAPLLCAALGIGEVGIAAAVGLGVARRLHHRAWIAALSATVHVAGLLLLVPRWGLWGVAVMALITALLATLLLDRQAQRAYPVPFRWPAIATLWLAGAALVAPAQLLPLSPAAFALKLVLLAAAAALPLLLRLVRPAELRTAL